MSIKLSLWDYQKWGNKKLLISCKLLENSKRKKGRERDVDKLISSAFKICHETLIKKDIVALFGF